MSEWKYLEVMQCTRANGSVNGNPNWVLTGRDENGLLVGYRTSSDLSISYGVIPNEVASKMPEPVAVKIKLTKANRISDLKVYND